MKPKEKGRRVMENNRKKISFSPIIFIIIIIAIVAIIFVVRKKSENISSNVEATGSIYGTFTYSDETTNYKYEFNETGTGFFYMQKEDSTEYAKYTFNFKIEGNQIIQNFLNKDLFGSDPYTYTYSINGDKLTLIGGEGTVTVGKKYTLTREK